MKLSLRKVPSVLEREVHKSIACKSKDPSLDPQHLHTVSCDSACNPGLGGRGQSISEACGVVSGGQRVAFCSARHSASKANVEKD